MAEAILGGISYNKAPLFFLFDPIFKLAQKLREKSLAFFEAD